MEPQGVIIILAMAVFIVGSKSPESRLLTTVFTRHDPRKYCPSIKGLILVPESRLGDPIEHGLPWNCTSQTTSYSSDYNLKEAILTATERVGEES